MEGLNLDHLKILNFENVTYWSRGWLTLLIFVLVICIILIIVEPATCFIVIPLMAIAFFICGDMVKEDKVIVTLEIVDENYEIDNSIWTVKSEYGNTLVVEKDN